MTVFMGSWQNDDAFHRIATIAAAMSIVVTAVYILRATGRVMMGPIENEEHLKLGDAKWNEKLAAIILVAGIVAIGIAPGWLNDLLKPAAEEITKRIIGN
jgi:NADH-quinone oxidoreductase subunit M